MFGYPCGFLNGNMFCGLFGATMFIRLSETDRTKLLAMEGASFFDPMSRGKGMSQYIVLPTSVLDDAREARGWLQRSTSYALALPLKKPKTKARSRAKVIKR